MANSTSIKTKTIPFDLSRIPSNLRQDRQGIWRVERSASVSYRGEHHNSCFAVEENSFWFRHRANCIIQAIESFPPHDVVLDIGGGNGFMTETISRAGFQSILMEPGENGIRNAVRRGLNPLICSTLEEASLPEHVIPSIGVFDVIEHIEDDVQFMKSLHTHLIPDGKLYLTVPSYTFLWSSADDEAGHYRRYTLHEINDKLRATGFEVLYATYNFCLLPLPVLLMRSLPYRLGFSSQPTEERQLRQHGAKLERSASLVDKMFSWELNVLKKRKTIPFGASCLVVAAART
jgi:SAM-dependent methyltransferase